MAVNSPADCPYYLGDPSYPFLAAKAPSLQPHQPGKDSLADRHAHSRDCTCSRSGPPQPLLPEESMQGLPHCQ